MKRKERNKIRGVIGIGGILFFLFIIWYCVKTNFHYYIADSVIFIILTILLFIFYRQWKLDTCTFLMIVVAFILHDLGAFRFYASPPLPFEWDIVTHVVGVFAATLFLYNLALHLTKKNHHPYTFFIIILAALGIGVVIEFIEFYGLMTTGFGEGFLGRGFGDFNPAIVSSDYIDTIQDLFWNLVGATLGFIVAFVKEKMS